MEVDADVFSPGGVGEPGLKCLAAGGGLTLLYVGSELILPTLLVLAGNSNSVRTRPNR